MEGLAGQFGRLDPRFGSYLKTRPEHVWAALTGLAAIALLLSGGYKRLERITTALVAGVTLITVACVVMLAAVGAGARANSTRCSPRT